MPRTGGKKSVPPQQVTAEKFIECWERSDTADDVAYELGMSKPAVHARASAYREQGIRLKSMKRPDRKVLDVAALNKLIEQINEEKGTTPPPPRKKNKLQFAADTCDLREVFESIRGK